MKPYEKSPEELLLEIRNILTLKYPDNNHKHLTSN